MSNFKLKHQSKSGLLRHKLGHVEFPEPKKKIYIPSEVERPIEYIPSYQKVYEPPRFPDIKKMPKIKKISDMPKPDFSFAEEQQMRLEESMRKHKELVENIDRKVIPDFDITSIDATTGKPYDDSEEGRKSRVIREQAAGMRDEMGYQTPQYEEIASGLQMVKDNSNTPYKLPHMPPFKQTVSSAGNNEETDSIASVKAFNELKQSYLGRKFKGNDERLGPITPEQNLDEYNRESREFYYDPNEGKLRLIPTDDAEMQNLTGIKPYQLAPKDE